jgi:hypothetical protein
MSNEKDKRKPMKNIIRNSYQRMKRVVAVCSLVLLLLLVTVPGAYAQTDSYNPFLIQGIIGRTTTGNGSTLLPVEFNGTGYARFDVGNTGSSDMPLVANDRMTLVITLSKGVPNAVNPLDALSGDGVQWFDWQYDSTIATYTATQNQTIPGSSRRTIIIAYRVTQNSFLSASPTRSNGFNVNLQPPGYTNPQPTDDDVVSSYTYVEARDYGDAPLSYGEAWHNIDLRKRMDGTDRYLRYVRMGQHVDPEDGMLHSAEATGDDSSQTGGLGVDDEDGVTFPDMNPGDTVTIPVQVFFPSTGMDRSFLHAWIDWNRDGSFDEDERITDPDDTFAYSRTSSGVINVEVTVPIDAIGGNYFARFRFGPEQGEDGEPLGPTGGADWGEVEDYRIQINGLTEPASVAIEKVLNTPSPVRVGEVVSFTIRITNTSSSAVLTVVPLADLYNPALLYFVGASIAPDDPTNDGAINWSDLTTDPSFGDLAAGESRSLTTTFIAVRDTTSQPGMVAVNRATVDGAVPDPDGDGPQAPQSPLDPVEDSADVQILAPTSVLLAESGVSVESGGVRIHWQTVNESAIAGFYLLRRGSDGSEVEVTSEMLAALSVGQPVGNDYTFIDATAQMEQIYTYVLVVVDTAGHREEVEIGITGYRLMLPSVMR